jgi:addiction module HigA family antidote
MLDPISPGEILKEDFLVPIGLSDIGIARDIGVPLERVTGIVCGSCTITTDTAQRLGAYFGIEPEFWMNLQMRYDLRMARRTDGDALKASIRPLEAATQAGVRRLKYIGK